MDVDNVRRWIAAAAAELSELSVEADRVQFRLADKRRQLMLLYEVLASLTSSPVAVPADHLGTGASTRTRVQSATEQILRDRGQPMRIQHIHAEFVRRGIPLPGRGTPTNIAAHLVDLDRFRRFGRGIYGLAAWDKPTRAPDALEEADSQYQHQHADPKAPEERRAPAV